MTFDRGEFEIVIVIGELEAGIAGHLGGAVEGVGDIFPVRERLASFDRNPRHHDVLVSDCFGVRQHRLPPVELIGWRQMR